MCIRVADTGIGISPEHRARIFEPFFTTHGRAVARGMGLPMVQGMVAQHGGWMEIKTDVGKGTTVALFLPVKQLPVAEGAPVDPDGTMSVDPVAFPGRMLVADDEPFIRRLIKKVFRSEGWQIDEAKDNDEVLEKVGGNGDAYNLIVLDLTMPGASTEETIRHISRTDPAARILFISGYARDERIERLLGMTKSDFISKPFSPKELLTRVDELVR
jgi:two-component system, cell cycle sensor histidine kinase and response regulator CckA